jgi:hypothetical protein
MNLPDKVYSDISTVLAQIENQVIHYAPTAWEILKQVKQVSCIGTLLIGALAMLFTIFTAWLCTYVLKLGNNPDLSRETREFYAQIGLASGFLVLVLIPIILANSGLLDIWNYVGVFNPGLAIAHDLIVKTLGQ